MEDLKEAELVQLVLKEGGSCCTTSLLQLRSVIRHPLQSWLQVFVPDLQQ